MSRGAKIGMMLAMPAAVIGGGTLLIQQATGIGPAAGAYESRLKAAEALGFDPGLKRMEASDAAKEPAARAAFDRLYAGLSAVRERRMKAIFGPPMPKVIAPVRMSLAELRGLGAAARRAKGGRHRLWSLGPALELPDLVGIGLAAGSVAKLPPLQRTQGAREAADILRVYADEPLAWTQLILAKAGSGVFYAVRSRLEDPTLSGNEAREIGQIFADPQMERPVASLALLTTQISMMIGSADAVGREPDEGGLYQSRSWEGVLARSERVRRAWKSDVLRLYLKTASRLPADPYDWDSTKAVMRDHEDEANNAQGVMAVLTQMSAIGGWSSLVDAQRRWAAEVRVIRTAARLRLHQPPGAEGDPFSGSAIRVVKGGSGRIVYSIGPDGTDDGGRPMVLKKMQGDIAIRVPG